MKSRTEFDPLTDERAMFTVRVIPCTLSRYSASKNLYAAAPLRAGLALAVEGADTASGIEDATSCR